ncbi:MAG: HAMP domain-containing protein [Myxococcales bacterium]|nr:HAMP domain-containing protein [Myxococcales bacterium]
MDFRTKFIFTFVAVALGSMLALGAFTYDAVRDRLRALALRQLDAVAEGKKQDLERVITAWRDRVQLLANVPRMRDGLPLLPDEADEAVPVIEAILRDALGSSRALRGITLYRPDGYPIASAGLAPSDEERLHPATFFGADAPVAYQNVFHDPGGELVVAFVAPIRREGRKVGAIKVLLAATELVSVTEDYTGLGETGETLMALGTEDGGALVVNPLRHDPEASLRREIAPEREDDPLIRAVRGEGGVWDEGMRDYRGQHVWAATRTLEEFGWGLVVKIDAAEESLVIAELRDTMIRLALSLSAFAIVAGALLGLYFSRPIHELADVVRRFGAGEEDLRAEPGGEDEIALLARSFNEMADELSTRHRELEKRARTP